MHKNIYVFSFRNSNTPYYLLSHNIIARPILFRKCFFICILLFLSGEIQLNSGTVSLNNQYASSPLDVYEPVLSPITPNLRIATLNSRSVLNKPAIINSHILENKIDILYITETWINRWSIYKFVIIFFISTQLYSFAALWQTSYVQ